MSIRLFDYSITTTNAANLGKKVLLWSDALYIFAGGLIGPIYAIYVQGVGGDILETGGAFSIFMITAGVIIYFLGKWEDRQKHQAYFVVLGYLLGVIGFTGYLFVNSSLTLFLVSIILGITVAIKDPAYDGLYSKFARRHATFAWGEWEAFDYLALGVSALVGGAIVKFLGFKPLIILMIIFSLIGFFISLFLLKFRKVS